MYATMHFENCVIINNYAEGEPLSVYFFGSTVPYGTSPSLGDGGGISIASTVSDTPLNVGYCASPGPNPPPQYRQWHTSLLVNITNTVVSENTVNCTSGTCSGGGLAMYQHSAFQSGQFTVSKSIFEGNYASTFGGGLFLGGPAPGHASCSISLLDNTVVSNNSALRAGNQIYNNCGGSFTFSNSSMELLLSDTEVCFICNHAVCQCPADIITLDRKLKFVTIRPFV